MHRSPVASSNVRAVGYNARNRKLEVEFLNGAVYEYPNVSIQQHRDLMGAESKGRFMHDTIIPGRDAKRVEEPK